MVIRTQVVHDRPRVEYWSNFLERDQIDSIVQYQSREFKRSFGYVTAEQKSKEVSARTSSTSFDRGGSLNPIKELIYHKLKPVTLPKLELDHMEPLQVTRYEAGQFYQQHVDFFNGERNPNHILNDRIATVVIYLNDDFTGGCTTFPLLNLHSFARCGSAVYFQYDYDDIKVRKLTEHIGTPPLSGVKYIITSWIRASRWPDGTKAINQGKPNVLGLGANGLVGRSGPESSV